MLILVYLTIIISCCFAIVSTILTRTSAVCWCCRFTCKVQFTISIVEYRALSRKWPAKKTERFTGSFSLYSFLFFFSFFFSVNSTEILSFPSSFILCVSNVTLVIEKLTLFLPSCNEANLTRCLFPSKIHVSSPTGKEMRCLVSYKLKVTPPKLPTRLLKQKNSMDVAIICLIDHFITKFEANLEIYI